MEIQNSPAADRNKEPILNVLKEVIQRDDQRLLEVGAGTGQHAVFLAPFFPSLNWTPTEMAENLPMLKRRIEEARIPNITTPFRLQVGENDFPIRTFDLILTINTFHIMHWKEVKTFVKLVSGRLEEGGKVLVYGPFNYGGSFTTASNEAFDKSLKEVDPLRGLRNFEDVVNVFEKNQFKLQKDYEMPSNNRMLVFRRLKHIKARCLRVSN